MSKYHTASSLLGSTGTAIGVADGTLGATGVGIIAGGSLIGLGALLGAGSVISMQVEKRISEKLMKYSDLVALADSKPRTVEKKILNALADKRIDEKEFEQQFEEKYYQQRKETSTPKLLRQSKNSQSTRELADQLDQALKSMKRSSQSL